MANSKKSFYVCELSPEQIAQLESILKERGWAFKEVPYAYWQAALDKTNVTAYLSGKTTVQGKNLEELVLYVIEPEVLKSAGFGYEDLPGAAGDSAAKAEPEPEEPFTPHGGIDESGKGDFFGPLVIAAVFADDVTQKKYREIGVRDSKTIKSGKKIKEMANAIRNASGGKFVVVTIGPESYNRLYNKIGNLNRLLAWGHARAIENLLDKAPECPRMLSDKFGSEHLIRNALLKNGRNVKLEQRTKAESDVAVAAASILARDMFLSQMDKLSAALHLELPRGASPAVETVARELVDRHGADELGKYAKLHFKTLEKVLPGYVRPGKEAIQENG
ncbi:MAG: ribonuclease HIII [Lentisphaerota bacterium]